MGRTNRLSRHDLPPSSRPWFTMDSAPLDGSKIELWIPYTVGTEEICSDVGYWDANAEHRTNARGSDGKFVFTTIDKGCFRFSGDDGVFDIQPTAWRPHLAHEADTGSVT